ncbi:MAG: hypothetical protein K0R62_3466 [Nonomuraea muscovyensis]|nr:hypothetical protein [Nonomuraea muscovyensis]
MPGTMIHKRAQQRDDGSKAHPAVEPETGLFAAEDLRAPPLQSLCTPNAEVLSGSAAHSMATEPSICGTTNGFEARMKSEISAREVARC